ncbi:hypothetical protein GYH30_006288 [Glycine max]|nr:hypothetical protein GYH30_006288 [Glycine max]
MKRLVPWGNAWIAPDGTVVCQHGDDECFLNTIEACAITIYPDVVQHFRYVRCLENLTLEGRHNQWVNCFQMTGLGTSPIDCYTSGNGKAIDQKYAKETAQLNPPHRFVPWVVVNNQALQEDYQNFLTIGSVQLNKLFEDLGNLNTLNLSYNNLPVNVNEHLQNITNLSVLDLHQNKLQGPIYFTTWKRNVTHNEDEAGSKFIMKICYFPTDFYYQDSLIVTSIGLQMELVKVLTIFTSIDFSSNHFEGPIPKDLMNFKTICVLNSSNNALSGEISSSIVNLKELESLDLSQN